MVASGNVSSEASLKHMISCLVLAPPPLLQSNRRVKIGPGGIQENRCYVQFDVNPEEGRWTLRTAKHDVLRDSAISTIYAETNTPSIVSTITSFFFFRFFPVWRRWCLVHLRYCTCHVFFLLAVFVCFFMLSSLLFCPCFESRAACATPACG